MSWSSSVSDYVLTTVLNARRRRGWFANNLTPSKLANASRAAFGFATKRETAPWWPLAIKIDISPLCNIHCTSCVHANPNGNLALKSQSFGPKQIMTVPQFRRIIDEVRRHTFAVSLYYYGDPFLHPNVDEMCGIARSAGINVHLSSHFGFKFTDERLKSILESGVTHLTVCVDGLTQEVHSRTRVGSDVATVLSNLERLLEIRRRLGHSYPFIEVQYLRFQHNLHQLPDALRLFKQLGVDHVDSKRWGGLGNVTDRNPENYQIIGPKKNSLIPQCVWPYFFIVIKFNGDVIPCCNHRAGVQHTDSSEKRVLGNVFSTSVWDVWNSTSYRAIRRLVSNPERSRSEMGISATFCEGCNVIEDTTAFAPYGNHHDWEEFYQLDKRGRAVRR